VSAERRDRDQGCGRVCGPLVATEVRIHAQGRPELQRGSVDFVRDQDEVGRRVRSPKLGRKRGGSRRACVDEDDVRGAVRAVSGDVAVLAARDRAVIRECAEEILPEHGILGVDADDEPAHAPAAGPKAR
jgi:hypothetical protein